MVESAIRKEAQNETKDLQEKPNHVFKFVKLMKRNGKDVIGGRCMKGKDGSLAFTQQDENERDQITDVDVVEGRTYRKSYC